MTFNSKSLSLAAILAASVSGAAIAQENTTTETAPGVEFEDEGSMELPQDEMGTNTDVSTGMDGTGSMDSTAGMDSTTEMDSGSEMSASNDMEPGNSDKWTYGKVLSSMKSGENTEVDLSTVEADAEIDTIKLSEVSGNADENAQSLDTALAQNESEMDEFQNSIADNDQINAAVEADGFSSDNVLGVYKTANGTIEVLIDDRA